MDKSLRSGDRLHIVNNRAVTPFGEEVPLNVILKVEVTQDDQLARRTGLPRRQYTSLMEDRVCFMTGSISLGDVGDRTIIVYRGTVGTISARTVAA